ncbi:MAG TPA: hypothetical protein VMD09_05545 [Solirubrobacteraceae bacterium]|nr:hypothetical protein [Solirubrobacteraceae bacterium]
MPQSSENGDRSAKPKTDNSPPVWRMPFDVVERPVTSSSESWVQSNTFMDGLSIAWKLQQRLRVELHRGLSLWFGVWNLPSRGDVNRVSNQLANVERQLRALRAQLEEDEPEAGDSKRRPATRRDRG